jgi:phosphate transport system permease protein
MTAPARPLDVPVARLTLQLPLRRRVVDAVMRGACVVATALVLFALGAIIVYVVVNGVPGLSAAFLTQPAAGFGEGGALQAILGTLQLVPLAALIAAPIGILGGIFVAEFAGRRGAAVIRFAADVMVGLPSVVVGVFAYAILVAPFGAYNAFAGIIALAIIMLPVVLRTTEEILRLVPTSVREAALALGMPVWRTTTAVVLRTALAGLLTGVMLAVARAAGETAPLLFTALGSRLVNVGDLRAPMDALPLFIYANSGQPDPYLVSQAWAASLLLLVLVFVVNVLVRARTFGRRIS